MLPTRLLLVVAALHTPSLQDLHFRECHKDDLPTIALAYVKFQDVDCEEREFVDTTSGSVNAFLHEMSERVRASRSLPPLCDCRMFGTTGSLESAYLRNRAYRELMSRFQIVDFPRCVYYYDCHRDAELLGKIYDLVVDAQKDYHNKLYRRQCLSRLRDLLGYENYYRGQLPPELPLHRFRPID